MKRNLHKLLLAPLIVSTVVDPAQGAQKKKKSRKTTTNETVFTAQPAAVRSV